MSLPRAAIRGARGSAASSIRRRCPELRSEAEAAFQSGTNIKDAGVKAEIAEALEGLAERNLTGEELAAFQQARRQYNATLIAEKAVDRDGSGNIRIEALDAATKKHRRVAHRQGTEDPLVKLARMGQHLRKVRIPDSGTTPRAWWLKTAQNPLTLGTGGAGLGHVAGGDCARRWAAQPQGCSMPWALSRGMYSPLVQNWLRNGLPIPARGQLINTLTRTAPGIFGGTTAAHR